ncbi:MAG: hypothetical protein ACMXYA_00370 [Candidatus Woesearchaeota archaeon]
MKKHILTHGLLALHLACTPHQSPTQSITEQLHTQPIRSTEEFFSLSPQNLATRVLLLEDDTFTHTHTIAEVMFQRAYEQGKTLEESLIDGSYSGVSYARQQVPQRALSQQRFPPETLELAYDIIKELSQRKAPFREDGADHFMHARFPSSYSLSYIKHNTNANPDFRQQYRIPHYAEQNTVGAKVHAQNEHSQTVLLLFDVY